MESAARVGDPRVAVIFDNQKSGCSEQTTKVSERNFIGARGVKRRRTGMALRRRGLNERVLQEWRKRIHLGPESCGEHREMLVEA